MIGVRWVYGFEEPARVFFDTSLWQGQTLVVLGVLAGLGAIGGFLSRYVPLPLHSSPP